MSTYCGEINMHLEKDATVKDLRAIAKILRIPVSNLNKGDICRAIAAALGTEESWDILGWDNYYDINSY